MRREEWEYRALKELIVCARALVAGETREDFGFLIEGGRILAAGDAATVRSEFTDFHERNFPQDRLVVPGFINGHSHAYQILLRGWADDWSFARWRSDALYRIIPYLTPDEIFRIFLVAFSEMLAAGITTVAEFFYLNGAGNAHAHAAIAAARETGIRLLFARTWMDAEYAPREFRESIEDAALRTDELRLAYPDASVCVAPHSLHAASPEMICAASAYAHEHQCKMHIHVAEAAYEGEQTLAVHGATPITFLERLGVLDERTVAIHAIYVSEDEKNLLAQRGASVIHNPTTNQYLGDGICDVVGLQRRGIRVGLGTDADVKPSIIDEMRAAALLQKVGRCDSEALGAGVAFDLGTAQGARALGLPCGSFEVGAYADYVVLDASRIDAWSPACNALVYRGEAAWVQASFVGGRRVYVGEEGENIRVARGSLAGILKRLL